MQSVDVIHREAIPHMQSLHTFALSLCRDTDEANDLVQETMFKALKHAHTYREGSNCKAWLFQICKYSHISTFRKRRTSSVPFHSLADFLIADDHETWTSAHVSGDRRKDTGHYAECSLHDRVSSALEGLPVHYQTVLILSDLEGFTYGEIAQFTGLPLGTVRSRIHRGRKILADGLRDFATASGYLAA